MPLRRAVLYASNFTTQCSNSFTLHAGCVGSRLVTSRGPPAVHLATVAAAPAPADNAFSAVACIRRMASTVAERQSWDEIKDYVHRGKTSDVDALGVLGRSVEDLTTYRAHRARILEKYASLTDELRSRLFGAPLMVADGKLAVDTPDPTASKRYVLVMENEFPYYVDQNISHINIWCSNGALSDETVEKLIAERLPSETSEYVWFVNPPKYQSVKAIWHCHVFVRNLAPAARVMKPGEAELWD